MQFYFLVTFLGLPDTIHEEKPLFFQFKNNWLQNWLRTDRPTDGPTDRRTDRPTDRRTDRRTDGRTDRPTDRPTDRSTENPNERFLFPLSGYFVKVSHAHGRFIESM